MFLSGYCFILPRTPFSCMFLEQAVTEHFPVRFSNENPTIRCDYPNFSNPRTTTPKIMCSHALFSPTILNSATLFNSVWSHVQHYLRPVFHRWWAIVVPFLAFSVSGLSFFSCGHRFSLLGSAESFFQCFEVL